MVEGRAQEAGSLEGMECPLHFPLESSPNLLDSEVEPAPQKSSQSRAVGVSQPRGNFLDARAAGFAWEEALFAGTSSGANVVAAIQVAKLLGPDAKVFTLMADSGLKYLSTDVYRRM